MDLILISSKLLLTSVKIYLKGKRFQAPELYSGLRKVKLRILFQLLSASL